MSSLLTIVIPAYNEATNIPPMLAALHETLDGIPDLRWEVLFIDDGSTDSTRAILRAQAAERPHVKFIGFSRNFGHQAALKAGLDHAEGDCVVTMDGDLQHPPELLVQLLARWREGFDVVYTLRADNEAAGVIKRTTSRLYYRFFNLLSDVELDAGAADFRLLDRKVVQVLRALPESGLFLRGLIRWVGFRQTAITYEPHHRFSGETKYSPAKMFKFALDGILAFSVRPLRLATLLGCLASGCAALYAIYALSVYFFAQGVITGWTSLLICVLFLGGAQLLTIGLLGEYIGRVLTESKRRPLYIVAEKK
jgi:polyisoprenyl-phosphate glycosyltransferase